MPISIDIQPILPPSQFFSKKGNKLTDAVVAVLQSTVTTTLVGALRERSEGWSTPPLWNAKVEAGGSIILTLKPSGPGAKKWLWVSAGTNRHDIVPVRRKVLAFNTSPGRKTGPAGTGRFGMSQAPTGEDVFAHHVDNPGIEARAFEIDVVDEKEGEVIAVITQAIINAMAG